MQRAQHEPLSWLGKLGMSVFVRCVGTPRCLAWTATRLSSVSAYGRQLPLDAATPSKPSTWAASRVGFRSSKKRYAGR
jgi:hypothetical protein